MATKETFEAMEAAMKTLLLQKVTGFRAPDAVVDGALAKFVLAVKSEKPYSERDVKSLVDGLSMADAVDVEVVLREFGTMIYELLGKDGVARLLGSAYRRFTEDFTAEVNARIVRAYMTYDETIESWVDLGIEAVSMNNGKRWRGTLFRGKQDEDAAFVEYVIDTGGSIVRFDTQQVKATVEPPDGSRMIIFDSPHPGVGVPEEVQKEA